MGRNRCTRQCLTAARTCAIIPNVLLSPQTSEAELDELVDTPTAGSYLGVTRKTVARYIRSGILPGFRSGQRWYVRRSDLVAFELPPGGQRAGYPDRATTRARERAVAVIAEHAGITVVELGEITGEPRRTALDRLQYLDRLGLITRIFDPEYSRQQRCYLTPAGAEAYDQLSHELVEEVMHLA